MVYENLKPIIENKKPTETVYEIEKYEIKKSPLSPAARNKVINKSGSNFLSDNKEGYGPVTLERVQTSFAPAFFLSVYCYNSGGAGGVKLCTSISQALRYAHDLEDGCSCSNVSSETRRKCAVLIREAVQYYDRGNLVHGYVKVQGKF